MPSNKIDIELKSDYTQEINASKDEGADDVRERTLNSSIRQGQGWIWNFVT